MANTMLSNTGARALLGEKAGLDPNLTYPPDGQQGGDPIVDQMTFLSRLMAQAQGIPRITDPYFKPPIVYFDDFFTGGSNIKPAAGDDPETDGEGFKFGTVDALNDWYIQGTNAANGNVVIEDAAVGGWLAIDTANVEDDALCAQLVGTPFKLATHAPLYFEARIMLEDVDKMSWFVGLAIANTDDVTGSGTWGDCDDCIGFHGEEELNINYASSKDGVDTTEDTGINLADGTIATIGVTTAMRLSFYWDGVDTVTFYIEGVEIASINTTDDDINCDEAMSPCIAVDASNADADKVKLWIDYIYVTQQRL